MKFDDLGEELSDDVLVTVDNEGFAELTEVYHELNTPSEDLLKRFDEDGPGMLNVLALKEKLSSLAKMHEQLGIPSDIELPEAISQKVLDLVESFQEKTITEFSDANLSDLASKLDPEEVSPVEELVKNSEYLKEKRDFARQYATSSTGKLHPSTKSHIDAYLKKHTGNCSDNFVTVTRIGPAPITPEQRKANEEAELQRQRAEAVNQIAKISRFLLEQAESGKISFAEPETELSPSRFRIPYISSSLSPTVKEKVLNKLGSIKSKFKQVKRELFYSALARVQKALNVE